ncbi:hypothetical protein ES707_06338 [subsurface metagenome]
MAVEEVKTSRELGFGEPKVGYEWDAGNTPPEDKEPGRWTVKRNEDSWVVLFHSSIYKPPQYVGPDYVIATFPPTEDGERAAKKMALKLVDMARGRDAGDKNHA